MGGGMLVVAHKDPLTSYWHKLILSPWERSSCNMSDHLIAPGPNMVMYFWDLARIGFLWRDPVFHLEWLSGDLIDYVFYYDRAFSHTCSSIGLSFYSFAPKFHR